MTDINATLKLIEQFAREKVHEHVQGDVGASRKSAQTLADIHKALEAHQPQVKAVSGFALAGIGRKHFGNPIPQEWYAAARDLLEDLAHPAPTLGAPESAGLIDSASAESAFLERERVLFENANPLPSSCVWTGRGYSATDYNAWSAHSFADKWKGWIARAKLKPLSSSEVSETFQHGYDVGHEAGVLHASQKPAASSKATLEKYAKWVETSGPGTPLYFVHHADGSYSVADPQPGQSAQVASAAQKTCWCETCRPVTVFDMRMVLCPTCGNKRCPKATHHANACTGSNEVGQKGSSWEHVKPAAAEASGQESLPKAAPAAPPRVQARYAFICANGCGECGVRLSEFEYERTESLSGQLIDRKVSPQLVSTCCGSEVDVYDNLLDASTDYKVTEQLRAGQSSTQ